ncbi:MAG: hypothetical protein II951_09700 [Bacteroidales bacterium]|nr:hypothetical protein [Bacteroidales bacterium]
MRKRSIVLAFAGAVMMAGCTGGCSKKPVEEYIKEGIVKQQVVAMFKAVGAEEKSGKDIEDEVKKYCTDSYVALFKKCKKAEEKYIEGLPKMDDGEPEFGDGWYPITRRDPWAIKSMGNFEELADVKVVKLTQKPATAELTATVNCYVPSSEECSDCDGWNNTPVRIKVSLSDTTWQIDNITHISDSEEIASTDFRARMEWTLSSESVVSGGKKDK